ncbi:MAG: hypothetical protein ACTSRP_15660 [Candidatus Helarchaeota archaeon]
MEYRNIIPVDKLEKYNLFSRIERIESLLREIKSWKDNFADPNIREHIRDIQNIYNNINKVIVPNINQALSQSKAAASNAVDAMKDAKASLEEAKKSANLAEGAKSRAEEILSTVSELRDSAREAAKNAKNAYDRLAYVGDGMVNDLKNLMQNTSYLLSVLKVDLANIAATFRDFGTHTLSNAKTLTEKLAELARQLGDAAKEIDKPLDYVIDRTKDMYDDIRSAARSLRRADALGAAGHIYDAIQNARKALEVLTYKGYGGQNSVLLELIEALKQITSAGLQVKNSVYKFGNDFGNDSDSIKNTIEVSITEIDDSMNSFIQSFYSVFENMQLRLKGER